MVNANNGRHMGQTNRHTQLRRIPLRQIFDIDSSRGYYMLGNVFTSSEAPERRALLISPTANVPCD